MSAEEARRAAHASHGQAAETEQDSRAAGRLRPHPSLVLTPGYVRSSSPGPAGSGMFLHE